MRYCWQTVVGHAARRLALLLILGSALPVAAYGCGRIGFDPLDAAGALDASAPGDAGASDASIPGDAGASDASSPTDASSPDAGTALPTSCLGLAPTCGPTASAPCCESPLVIGGAFLRVYDAAPDAFNDMSAPATVSDFRLDKYEVTVGRFRAFVEAGRGTQSAPPSVGSGAHPRIAGSGWNPAWNASLETDAVALASALACAPALYTWTNARAGNENRPITCVTWYEAMAFCGWDGGFLPTLAEWEYAAGGGAQQRPFPWSTVPTSADIDETRASYFVDVTRQCFGDMVAGCTLADVIVVGSRPAGDGRWGQADLAGNLWEWLLDANSGSLPTPCDDCADLTAGAGRLLHGGSYFTAAIDCRVPARDANLPAYRFNEYGFRCARSP